MNSNFISRALCFHGQPMQKIWEDERGAGDLLQCGVPAQPDYSIYQERQKNFTFQDRAKRLKLHQFFARKAKDLYDKDLACDVIENEILSKLQSNIAILPPYEVFVNKSQDKIKRWRCVLECIKPGDIIYGVILKSTIKNAPSMVKPLCTAEPLVRYLVDIPIKAYLQIPITTDVQPEKRTKTRNFEAHDTVCCEVLGISIDADRLYLGVEGVITKRKDLELGLVTQENLPEYYRRVNENSPEKFEEYLNNSKEFLNPNYDMLYEINGLNVNDTFTLMSSLKTQFPRCDYARELRRTQASKWAFRSVAEGIEHFKNGQHVEAFQCLNKALSIDPRNVEGLVARGALYANKGSFLKAIDDFEKALKLNSYHVNARKYMGETLVALGRRYEEENRIQYATKAYGDCLNIIPNHEQARLSLEAIQQKTGGPYFDNLLNIAATDETDKFAKGRTSGESSSDETSSDKGSSSDSEHSDGDGRKREASLSPLSKRMALHAATLEMQESQSQQFNQPFYMTSSGEVPYKNTTVAKNPNEFKLEDDDTESRVRKLLHEASKHKKEKKKSKKKKTKKSKRTKEKSTANILDKINFQEAYKAISSMNIENKLNENLQIYEKTIAEIRKRQEFLEHSSSIFDDNNIEVTRPRMDTPPPKAPSMRLPNETSTYGAPGYSAYPSTSTAAAAKMESANKLSFQIKRPVKIDKFGLVRIATPLAQENPLHSRSRSRSRSRGGRMRSRSFSRDRYRSRRRSYSRSSSRGRRGRRPSRRHSRSRSHSPRRGRSRSKSRSRHQRTPPPSRRGKKSGYYVDGVRRRTPSPFVPRNTPPPPRRRSKSRFSGNNSSNNERNSTENRRQHYGNRVWRRNESSAGTSEAAEEQLTNDGRWLHDKFNEDVISIADDGPSIEEIDEIINKAQKERKQEIINRDKDILKKPNAGT